MVISSIYLSQGAYTVPPVIHAVQGDTGRILWMYLTDTNLSSEYDSPYTAGLYFKRSDGTYYNEECMTDSTYNRCEAALDQALTQPGVTKCQLKIEDASGICSTFDFNIIVHESMSGVSEEQLGYSLEEIREIIEGASEGNQEVEDIRLGYDGVVYPSAGDAVRNQIVQAMENRGGLSNEAKDALLACFEKVLWKIPENPGEPTGRDYYDALYDALYPPATGVTLSASSWGSNVIGETYQLRAIVAPSGWSGTVVWSSSNTSVATVSQTGLVTVVGYGLCIISATADSVSAPCRVSVTQLSVKSISAVFNQGSNKIYDTDDFETEIKKYLTVTATMSDDSTQVLPSSAYGVNTTYLEGASTGSAQVAYNQKTSEWFSFNVTEWLTSLTAVYTQSGTVYDTDTLDSLKSDLVVTANYEDGTSATVSDYTLSGTLAEGTSTITVTYGGKIATFNVTVTHYVEMTELFIGSDLRTSTTTGTVTQQTGGVDIASTGNASWNLYAFSKSNCPTYGDLEGHTIRLEWSIDGTSVNANDQFIIGFEANGSQIETSRAKSTDLIKLTATNPDGSGTYDFVVDSSLWTAGTGTVTSLSYLRYRTYLYGASGASAQYRFKFYDLGVL